MKKRAYEIKAIPTTMRAQTSATLKIRDNFFKVELQEERVIPDGVEVDMDEEWLALFNEINSVCDIQIKEIMDEFKR